MAGRVGEVIIYNQTLTTAQRQQVQAYLTKKWRISGVPTTHPFTSILPATTSFNPRQISNCALWLDAADRYSLTLSGSNVSQWNDKSGNGFNLSQATAGNQPTYSNGVVNFLASSSNFMTNSSANGFGATATVFCVLRFASQSNMRGFSIGNGNTYIAVDSFNAGAFYNSTSGYYASSNQIVSTTGNRHARMVQRNGASIPRYSINGGTITNMETADSVISSTTHITVGTGGGGFATNFFTTGHIAEIIAYTSYLSDSQIRDLEGYLASKWGIQNSLPSTHPYKKISPI